MKHLILILFLSLNLQAAFVNLYRPEWRHTNITLCWDYYDTNYPPSYSLTNTFEPDVTTFILKWGSRQGRYEFSTNIPRGDVTNLYFTNIVSVPANITWFFSVSAAMTNYDNSLLESEPSNEINFRWHKR